MSSAFRLPADVLAGWRETLSRHRGAKGVEPVFKEVLAALLQEGSDGHVPVQRHQLFSWTQALQGAALKADATVAASLQAVAADMSSFLGGAPAPPAAAALVAPAAPPPPPGRESPPPVTYVRTNAAPAAPGPTTGTRLVEARELPALVPKLLREAKSEILVVAPWAAGLDRMTKELLDTRVGTGLQIVTRRPPNDDPEYHRALVELKRRGGTVVVSNALHTRMLIVDGATLLLGASAVVEGSKELALLTTGSSLVDAARAAFLEALRGP